MKESYIPKDVAFSSKVNVLKDLLNSPNFSQEQKQSFATHIRFIRGLELKNDLGKLKP